MRDRTVEIGCLELLDCIVRFKNFVDLSSLKFDSLFHLLKC